MEGTRVYLFLHRLTAGQQPVFMHVEIIRIYAFNEYYVPRPSSHLRVCHMVLQVTNIRVRSHCYKYEQTKRGTGYVKDDMTYK